MSDPDAAPPPAVTGPDDYLSSALTAGQASAGASPSKSVSLVATCEGSAYLIFATFFHRQLRYWYSRVHGGRRFLGRIYPHLFLCQYFIPSPTSDRSRTTQA